MHWQSRIVAAPDTLGGKPRIANTRIGVAFVLDLFASGWSEARVLEEYPHLSIDDLHAVFDQGRRVDVACARTGGRKQWPEPRPPDWRY